MQVDLEDFRGRIQALLDSTLPAVEDRYDALYNLDPYPEIEPALLHSGHLASYAIMTGMIDPFQVDAIDKPATYLVPIEGPVRYKDEYGKLQSFFLSKDPAAKHDHPDVRPTLTLRPNSLCYVTLKPTFRMPTYLAGRFNLLIRDVYRGLLVGTGPLVDPGFQGKLSIPLHNFTNNEYELLSDEGFVYFEFTKLSRLPRWRGRPSLPSWLTPAVHVLPPFPSSKNKRKTIDDYLRTATNGGPAQSALASELARLKSSTTGELTKLRDAHEVLLRRAGAFTVAGAIGLAGLVIGLAGLVFTAWQVYAGAQQFAQSAQTNVASSIDRVSTSIVEVRHEIDNARDQLESLRAQVLQLENERSIDPVLPAAPTSDGNPPTSVQ